MKSFLLPVVCVLYGILLNAQSPQFRWAGKLGGVSDDMGYAIRTDDSGNVYTTGLFKGSADFDPDTGTFDMVSAGGSDIFITKTNESGHLVWAKNAGGTINDVGRSVITDRDMNVFVTGTYSGKADFNPGNDTFFLQSNGDDDVFILKLDAQGNFIWAISIGGALKELSTSLASDDDGNIYITGNYNGTVDFDPGSNIYSMASNGGTDVFILKIDKSGNYKWAKSFGGSFSDIVNSVATDKNSNVYTTGSFDGTVDFNPDPSLQFNLTSFDYNDVFISKLDSTGQFIWARKLGGNSTDIGYSITISHNGDVYSCGEFAGISDFDPGSGTSFLTSVANSHDVYVSKLDASGNFLWAKSFGGNSEEDHGLAIAIDSSGNAYTTGLFAGTVDFDPGAGKYELSALGSYQIFISKLSHQGQFIWTKSLDVTNYNYGSSIALDQHENIYTTGYFSGTTDFNPGVNEYELTSNGKTDVFIHKMSQNPTENIPEIHPDLITLYPNPTNGILNFNIPDARSDINNFQMEIYDNLGQLLLTYSCALPFVQMDLKELASGIYILKITGMSIDQKTSYGPKKIIKS